MHWLKKISRFFTLSPPEKVPFPDYGTSILTQVIGSSPELRERFKNEEERRYLSAILGRHNKHTISAYQEWLIGRDDPLGRCLQLQESVPDSNLSSEDLRARLQQIERESEHLNQDLWHFLAPLKQVQNCGQARSEGWEVRFTYKCPKRWISLERTEHESIRFCSECREEVFLCKTTTEVEKYAQKGHCIALYPALTSQIKDLTYGMMGHPDRMQLWGRRIFKDQEH